jgi:hypothetical protein
MACYGNELNRRVHLASLTIPALYLLQFLLQCRDEWPGIEKGRFLCSHRRMIRMIETLNAFKPILLEDQAIGFVCLNIVISLVDTAKCILR